MKTRFLLFILFFFTQLNFLHSQTLWLDEIQASLMEAGWGESKANTSVEGKMLTVAGQTYKRGMGTHAVSKILFDLQKTAVQFSALVGVDDEAGEKASVEFYVLGDKKVLWKSGIMKKGDAARKVVVSLAGMQKLALLVTDGGDGIDYDHADWLEARIDYKEKNPVVFLPKSQRPYILTPPAGDNPAIHYPRITGARPGNPFLFKIPATGKQPLNFAADKLPEGLTLDKSTGNISGSCIIAGRYKVNVTVFNELGKDVQPIWIAIGDKLALTPPMGWNSWNCWGLSVDDAKVKAAAGAMAEKLGSHGWTYINIDDGWEEATRDESGNIKANAKFPDMKALSDYVHGKGLKLGIYSSPGETTCGGFLGSFGHEIQDARTWGSWGIDYLKYDWCSYEKQAANHSLNELKKPYFIMRDALKAVKRDIVFSLCQYGMGNVWEWGATVGGNAWRTTGDISDNWNSMAGIGFSQGKCSPYAKPGCWNDPDMLVVGNVGWGPTLHPSKLNPDEQYTHISLWCLLSAPLLIGCDMSHLDDFTLNLLTNDEVLAVNQDPAGNQAVKISKEGDNEIWVKTLDDGSKVVGLFYTRPDAEGVAAEFQWEETVKPKKLSVFWAQLGLSGPCKVRDLWRQKDLTVSHEKIEAEINWHGCALYKLTPAE